VYDRPLRAILQAARPTCREWYKRRGSTSGLHDRNRPAGGNQTASDATLGSNPRRSVLCPRRWPHIPSRHAPAVGRSSGRLARYSHTGVGIIAGHTNCREMQSHRIEYRRERLPSIRELTSAARSLLDDCAPHWDRYKRTRGERPSDRGCELTGIEAGSVTVLWLRSHRPNQPSADDAPGDSLASPIAVPGDSRL